VARNIIVDSWKSNNLATKVLRAWLGITWIYAGWQKASDVGFLSKASPSYIGAQLSAFAKNSPLSFFLERAVHLAQPVGWFIMLAEFAIGIAALSGVAIQLASLAGAVMSIGLWLSVSWSVTPYFLGSDTAYAVMWLVLFLNVRAHHKQEKSGSLIPDLRSRRSILQLGAVAVASFAGIFAANQFQKKLPVSSAGKEIVKLSAFPVGSSMQYTASDGNPAILFRTAVGVFAYSAVCTHQGCVVGYTPQTKTIDCPCHGGQYDPFNGAQVIAGPPPTPLATYPVSISGSSIVAG
jgi:thiosulfate dehydrogenase [quinone] large subunit